MVDEIAVLTALPSGVDLDRGVARLSMFITLRVRGDAGAVLADTRFMADWPDMLSKLLPRLEAEVAGRGTQPVDVVSAPPSQDVWRALLAPRTRIEPYENEALAHAPIATYAARALHDYAIEVLASAATRSPVSDPSSSALLGELGEAVDAWVSLLDVPDPRQLDGPPSTAVRERFVGRFSDDLADRLAARIEAEFADARGQAANNREANAGRHIPVDGEYLPATPPSGKGTIPDELHRFIAFHHRREQPPTPLPTAQELAEQLDLHTIQTALASYPKLLPMVGLVVDGELPLDYVQLEPADDPGRIRFVVADNEEAPRLQTPWTAFASTGPDARPEFRAAPSPDPVGERVAHGMLDLGFRERYELAQVDVDSAAHKTLNAAMTQITRSLLPRAVGTPDSEPPPALRSTGIALLQRDRASTLNAQLARGHNLLLDLEADGDAVLWAEDVTRGYRIDVLERRVGDTWRTLHARHGDYATVGDVAGVLAEAIDDEGFIELAVGRDATPPGTPPDPDGALRLHESMARWEGWSLSAPRPGLGMSRSPQPPTDGEPETEPVPSTNEPLPNGVPLTVAFKAQPGSLPRLRFGGEYRVRARAVDLAGHGPTLADADAILAAIEGAGDPPPVLPQPGDPFAFDRFDPIPAPQVVALLPDTEGESLFHIPIRSDHDRTTSQYAADTGYAADAQRHIAPPKASLEDTELSGCFDDAIGSGDPAKIADAYAVATREAGRLDAIHGEAQLEVPYLPDPWSIAAALVGLPGLEPGTVTRFDATGTLTTVGQPLLAGLVAQPPVLLIDWDAKGDVWWKARPLRLRVVEGEGPPVFDAGERVLTVGLAKSGRHDVWLSSVVDPTRMPSHGPLRHILARAPTPQARDALLGLARIGRLWAVAPARHVVLVHAVQHPVNAPEILALRALRALHDTHAVLSGEVRLHGASTDRVDMAAEWNEMTDVAPDAPALVTRSAIGLHQQVHLARDHASEPPGSARSAAARYVERDDLLLLGVGGPDRGGPQFQSAHEFYDTRHRLVRYKAVAVSRFREYFRPELTEPDGATTRKSLEVEVDVPSSAVPPPPRMLYAVPMFGWERSADPSSRVRTTRRRGGGLRLFLDRPWYESGDGELLGAVLWPGADCPVPDRLRAFVTQWGYDPIWSSMEPPQVPSAEHFRRRVAVGENLPLVEAGRMQVTVVGHEVEYDEERDLYLCDLELDLGEAYTPFVRLALVRYQPSSIDGCHISPVAAAQIAQVAPERVVTIAAASDDPRQVSVALSGPGHGPANGLTDDSTWGADIDVWVEERVDGIDDPDLGWQRTTLAQVVPDTGPQVAGGFIRWSGRVTLPSGHVPGQHRVVVAERERLIVDSRRPSFIGFGIDMELGSATTERIVFAESFVV